MRARSSPSPCRTLQLRCSIRSRLRATLSDEQSTAAELLLDNTHDGFTVSLLDGVTGSGKTEVYFEAIAQALAQTASRRWS